jgi:hypothetical protein
VRAGVVAGRKRATWVLAQVQLVISIAILQSYFRPYQHLASMVFSLNAAPDSG